MHFILWICFLDLIETRWGYAYIGKYRERRNKFQYIVLNIYRLNWFPLVVANEEGHD